MRVVLVLAALTAGSVLWLPRPLMLGAPQLAISVGDCSASPPPAARVIARALGFTQARKSSCYGDHDFFALADAVAPSTPVVRNLIAFSAPPPRSLSTSTSDTSFAIPAEVPWVSATGSVLAYVKIDALLLRMASDNPVATAFALENAGVSRDDIMNQTSNPELLFVRVQPISVARVLKIGETARRQLRPTENYVYAETAFVRDCDGALAALSGLALAQSRERARLMAEAAGTQLSEPLGAVDSGGRVVDAICGYGGDATVQQLVRAEQSSPGMLQGSHGELHASIVQTVDAAWRLKLPDNPPGKSWRGYSWGREARPSFISDGERARGDGVLSLEPNRASVFVPEWAFGALQHSPYATRLKRVSMELNPLQPIVVLQGKSLPDVKGLAEKLQEYVSEVGRRTGKSAQTLQAVYSLNDCTTGMNAALFRATRDAISHLHGKPFRYLQQTWLETLGDLNCTYEPETDDSWSSIRAPGTGGAGASVAVGY